MRTRLNWFYRFPAVTAALTVVTLLLAGLAQSGPSGAAVPLAVAALLVVAVSIAAVCGVHLHSPSDGHSSGRSRFAARVLIRQCDPDAAGHARARAPGIVELHCAG